MSEDGKKDQKTMIKKILLTLGAVVPFSLAGVSWALAGTVPSNYAQDVKNGQTQLASDANAKSQSDNVKNDELIEGQVDKDKADVVEVVEPQESEMEATQSSEPGQAASPDSSTSSSRDASPAPTNNSNSSTHPTGGSR